MSNNKLQNNLQKDYEKYFNLQNKDFVVFTFNIAINLVIIF